MNKLLLVPMNIRKNYVETIQLFQKLKKTATFPEVPHKKTPRVGPVPIFQGIVFAFSKCIAKYVQGFLLFLFLDRKKSLKTS